MGKWCFLVPKNNFAEYLLPHSTSSIHFTALSYTDRGAFILSVLLLKRLKTVENKTLSCLCSKISWYCASTPIPFSLYNISFDSYIKPQLYLFTSFWRMRCISFDSYIKPQLKKADNRHRHRCISFDSYIKPQLLCFASGTRLVVYLLIPTSNHNSMYIIPSSVTLYIFWFLHQTTTLMLYVTAPPALYIFWFLHQTTTLG